MSGLVDALAHLDDPRIDEPVASLLRRAATAGVSDVVTAGVDPLLDEAVDGGGVQGAREVRVWRAYGVHPRATGDNLDNKLARLADRLAEPNVIAVGECGLDRRPSMPPIERQLHALDAQLSLAAERDLPVILHIVHATGLALEVLRSAGALRGYWHAFSGSVETADAVTRGLGLSLSFGGQVADPKARRCRDSAVTVPLDKLLVESGTPDHPPSPVDDEHGDRPRSEPAHAARVAEVIAGLRGVDTEQVAKAARDNARRLLRLDDAGR